MYFCFPSARVDTLWFLVCLVGEGGEVGKEVAAVKVASVGNFKVLTLFFVRFSSSDMWR